MKFILNVLCSGLTKGLDFSSCLCLASTNTEKHALNKNEIQEKWYFKEWKSN